MICRSLKLRFYSNVPIMPIELINIHFLVQKLSNYLAYLLTTNLLSVSSHLSFPFRKASHEPPQSEIEIFSREIINIELYAQRFLLESQFC